MLLSSRIWCQIERNPSHVLITRNSDAYLIFAALGTRALQEQSLLNELEHWNSQLQNRARHAYVTNSKKRLRKRIYRRGAQTYTSSVLLWVAGFCHRNPRAVFRKRFCNNKQIPWSESASELYRLSDRRLSAKSLPAFADKGCLVVSVTDPYGRTLGFLDRSRYFSIK
jgi:hypothetical protein